MVPVPLKTLRPEQLAERHLAAASAFRGVPGHTAGYRVTAEGSSSNGCFHQLGLLVADVPGA